MREMKDSGVEWLGAVPRVWEVTRFKYVVNSFVKGSGITKEEVIENGDTPCVRYGEIYSKYENHFSACVSHTNANKLPALIYAGYGDLLFAGTGELIEEIGKNIVYDGNDEILVGGDIIVAKHKHNPYYLNFAMNCLSSQEQKGYGKAKLKVVHISASEIGNIWIALPHREEQDRIADYLNCKCAVIDNIISKQEQIIEKLKEYKLSLITEAVTKGLDPNAEMKDSGYAWIGSIPAHWEMVYAKQLFTQRKERAYDDDEQLTASQQYGIISQKTFMEQEGRQVMQVFKGEDILKHVESGDFVISMRSFQGGLEYSELSGKISSAYVMLIPNKKYVYDRYYKWLFKSKQYISALQGTSNLIRDGQALRFSNFVQVFLPKLSISEQKKIADYLDKICPQIDIEVKKRELMKLKLQEYKKSLIYEVVTGKKEV